MNITPQQLEQILDQQLKMGRDSNELWALGLQMGVPPSLMEEAFQKKGLTPPSAKTTLDPKTIWDPTDYKVAPESFKKANAKIEEKIKNYKENPNKPFRNLLLCSIPGILALGIAGSSWTQIIEFMGDFNETAQDGIDGFYWVFLFFTPAFWYWAHISALQRDSIKMMLAQEKNWLYNAGNNHQHWETFHEKFPEISKPHGHDHNLQDEFWGRFGKTDFYAGLLEYKVRQHKRKTKTYYFNIFALKLPTKNKADFVMLSQKSAGVFGFFKSKIQTESAEFNKEFKITYNGETGEKALHIIQTLSPAVQEELLKFKKEHKSVDIIFRDGTMVFRFRGRLLPKLYTNFFKDIRLDPRDKTAIDTKMKKVLKISEAISKYLD